MWEVIENRRGNNDDVSPRSVRLSRSPKHKGIDAVRIRIGEELCREYRLLIGDRVQPAFDFEAGFGRLTRTTTKERSYAVAASGKRTKHTIGKIATAVVTFSVSEKHLEAIFPNGIKTYVSPSAEVADEGILFELAKDK